MLWGAMSVEVSGGLEPLRRVLGFGVMVLERSEGSEPLWTNDHHDGARGSMRMYSIHRCKYYSLGRRTRSTGHGDFWLDNIANGQMVSS